MSKTHELKTHPEPFTAVLDGKKRYELREDDRGFEVGDTLVLQEWSATPTGDCHDKGHYSGREFKALVTYLSRAPFWGLTGKLCVLSIVPATANKEGEQG